MAMNGRKPPNRVNWLSRINAMFTSNAPGQPVSLSAQTDEAEGLLAPKRGNVVGQIGQSREKEKELPRTFLQQCRMEAHAFFLTSKLNILLVFLPMALVAKYGGWGDGLTFVFSMLALAPLAERLGFVTEQLAAYTNDTLGGLINATFGNATEVIISGFALSEGLLRVVQLSLLGSVISNLLLVMGSAFIVGGIRHTMQSFNQQGASVNCGLLMLSVVAIMLPSLLSETHTLTAGTRSELLLSRFESVLLLGCYVLFLIFQLCTHRHLYEDDDVESQANSSHHNEVPESERANAFGSLLVNEEVAARYPSGGGLVMPSLSRGESRPLMPLMKVPSFHKVPSFRSSASHGEEDVGDASGFSSGVKSGTAVQMVRLSRSNTPLRSAAAAAMMAEIEERHPVASSPRPSSTGHVPLPAFVPSVPHSHVPLGGEQDDAELSKPGCFAWLAVSTAVIALLSGFIVDAIEGASEELKIPMPFLVTIVLPIVGNAAEHASALIFAWKGRMEIALGVAVGSSIQISVLVVPFCVVLAWAMGQPLDLNFNSFEAAVLFLSVLIAAVCLQDGQSNWIKGVLLLLTYVMTAAGFWFHADSDLSMTVDAAAPPYPPP